MDAYTSFAQVYDLFMDNVPYDKWCSWICDYLRKENVEDGLILDLGCGTGKLTRLMAKEGYDMIGIDMSYDMLDIAREQEMLAQMEAMDRMEAMDQMEAMNQMDGRDAMQEEYENYLDKGREILYLQQDMREFELYGTVRAIYSSCDCINYLMEEEDVEAVFRLANNYLDPEGLFIFDVNTPYKYEKLLGDNTFAEDREESSFIWNNFYDKEEGVNQYDLSIFVREEDGRFQRFRETHYQRSYSLETLKTLIERSGMEFVAAFDAYSYEPVREDSEKITIVAREKYHSGKTYVTEEQED